MRLTERLMFIFGAGLAVVFALELYIYCLVFCALILITIIVAIFTEGFRIFQWLFVIVFIPQVLLVFMEEYNIVALIIFSTVVFFGLITPIFYGDSNFSLVELSGPYEVGHKDIFMSVTGNAVSVFYPMDKDVHNKILDEEPERNTQWLRYGYNTRLGGARATAPWGKEYHSHPFIWKFVDGARLDTAQDGELAKDFADGSKTLVPVIYSHGLTSTRTFQSGSCRDLASNGYIVFAPDHHDGTCNYSRLKNGEERYWTSMLNPDDQETFLSRLEVRLTEVKQLIDDIENQSEMLEQTLQFGSNAKIDMDKLIVGGHSFGGMTGLYSGYREERVKAVFGFDAWIWPVVPKVMDQKIKLTQPQF